MTHANAPLTPEGRRRLAVLIVDNDWTIGRAAERFQVSPATAKRWADRYRAGESMNDRSSRPHSSPRRVDARLERQIVRMRFRKRWGPHRLAYHFGMNRSTIERVLKRYNMPLLAHVDQMTGLAVRCPDPHRYEVGTPGELVHVDIKKQGKIPGGGGWRVHGRGSPEDKRADRARGKAARAGASSARGYRYLHHAVDDRTRIAYSEILDDEKKETAAGFWERANAFFLSIGVTVTAVMTDNGACYRSKAFAEALGPNVAHRRTRPYRPQTNGKVERFNRTLSAEWAYAEPYASEQEREAAYIRWLHNYNHHRPHTALGGLTPSASVHNVSRKYI